MALTLEVVMARKVVPVNIKIGITGYVVLYGYSVKESTGTASAEVDLLNGASSAGDLAIPITLSAGQSTEDWFGPQGLHMPGGVYQNVTSGSIAGSLFVCLDWS